MATSSAPRAVVLAAMPLALLLTRCAGGPPPLQDLDGGVLDVVALGQPSVLVFARTDCPLTGRYAPEVRRLSGVFGPRGVRFWLVFPDAAEPASEIRGFVAAHQPGAEPLRDPAHAMAAWCGATVTPEAAVVDAAGRLRYCGRIDDGYMDLGRPRGAVTRRDLAEALDALLEGRDVPPPGGPPVGCAIGEVPGR